MIKFEEFCGIITFTDKILANSVGEIRRIRLHSVEFGFHRICEPLIISKSLLKNRNNSLRWYRVKIKQTKYFIFNRKNLTNLRTHGMTTHHNVNYTAFSEKGNNSQSQRSITVTCHTLTNKNVLFQSSFF